MEKIFYGEGILELKLDEMGIIKSGQLLGGEREKDSLPFSIELKDLQRLLNDRHKKYNWHILSSGDLARFTLINNKLKLKKRGFESIWPRQTVLFTSGETKEIEKYVGKWSRKETVYLLE